MLAGAVAFKQVSQEKLPTDANDTDELQGQSQASIVSFPDCVIGDFWLDTRAAGGMTHQGMTLDVPRFAGRTAAVSPAAAQCRNKRQYRHNGRLSLDEGDQRHRVSVLSSQQPR